MKIDVLQTTTASQKRTDWCLDVLHIACCQLFYLSWRLLSLVCLSVTHVPTMVWHYGLSKRTATFSIPDRGVSVRLWWIIISAGWISLFMTLTNSNDCMKKQITINLYGQPTLSYPWLLLQHFAMFVYCQGTLYSMLCFFRLFRCNLISGRKKI